MSHHDREPEKASSNGPVPDAAFRRSMLGVQTRCGQLASLIADHDFEGVEQIARDAVTMWSVGRAACRRLLARSPATSPLAEAARCLLEANYIALLELFARATKTIAVPRMAAALDDLRGTLVAAMSQPPVDPVGRSTGSVSRGQP